MSEKFSHSERKIFRLSAKIFRRNCEKSILRVPKNILGIYKKHELVHSELVGS